MTLKAKVFLPLPPFRRILQSYEKTGGSNNDLSGRWTSKDATSVTVVCLATHLFAHWQNRPEPYPRPIVVGAVWGVVVAIGNPEPWGPLVPTATAQCAVRAGGGTTRIDLRRRTIVVAGIAIPTLLPDVARMSYNPYPFAANAPTGLVYGVAPVAYVG